MRSTVIGFVVALAVGMTASVASAGDPGSGSNARQASCGNITAPVVEQSSGALRKSILCLINAERQQRDIGKLKRNGKLQRSAQKHTDVMVESNCLGHQCGGEPDLQNRLQGYLRGATAYQFGENTGCATTAKSMVANWMASKFHRSNILTKKFKDAGVGYSEGRIPSVCSERFGSFTVVFGYRKG